MEKSENPRLSGALCQGDDVRLPAAAYLRYESRADGWGAGRQAACLAHLADNGVATDAARSVGMSVGGAYALRRTARGYAFNLGWEAALIVARRIVSDNVMTAAIRGEQSTWVREEGVTTYTRQNSKLAMTLLDRVNPATALPEVLAVATRFDCFLEMIDDGLTAAELWDYFFDVALPRSEGAARERVRVALQLSEESAGFDEFGADGPEDDAPPIEYKSMNGPAGGPGGEPVSRKGAKVRSSRAFPKRVSPLHRSNLLPESGDRAASLRSRLSECHHALAPTKRPPSLATGRPFVSVESDQASSASAERPPSAALAAACSSFSFSIRAASAASASSAAASRASAISIAWAASSACSSSNI